MKIPDDSTWLKLDPYFFLILNMKHQCCITARSRSLLRPREVLLSENKIENLKISLVLELPHSVQADLTMTLVINYKELNEKRRRCYIAKYLLCLWSDFKNNEIYQQPSPFTWNSLQGCISFDQRWRPLMVCVNIWA